MKSGGGASGWGIGFIGVNDSETNKDETFIKNSSSLSFIEFMGNTFITESEMFAPADFDRAESSSKEKFVLTLTSLMVSKCFSNFRTPLSR